jgi:hypothetical protein
MSQSSQEGKSIIKEDLFVFGVEEGNKDTLYVKKGEHDGTGVCVFFHNFTPYTHTHTFTTHIHNTHSPHLFTHTICTYIFILTHHHYYILIILCID